MTTKNIYFSEKKFKEIEDVRNSFWIKTPNNLFPECLHRKNGPALEYIHINKIFWYHKDIIHRDNGPYLVSNNLLNWAFKGNFLTEQKYWNK